MTSEDDAAFFEGAKVFEELDLIIPSCGVRRILLLWLTDTILNYARHMKDWSPRIR